MSNRSDLIAAVNATGSHFFSKGAMRYFNSRVESRDVIPVDRERGLWVFVSSEQMDDDTFPTEREARDYAGDDFAGTVFHDAPAGLKNGDGSQAEWWVVRHPRVYRVRTVNTGEGDRSCIETPDSLNNGGEHHTTRESAWAVATAHAQAWHERMSRNLP